MPLLLLKSDLSVSNEFKYFTNKRFYSIAQFSSDNSSILQANHQNLNTIIMQTNHQNSNTTISKQIIKIQIRLSASKLPKLLTKLLPVLKQPMPVTQRPPHQPTGSSIKKVSSLKGGSSYFLNKEPFQWFGGTQSRFGLSLMLASSSCLIKFASSDSLSHIVSRQLVGEGMTQLAMAVLFRSSNSVHFQWHLTMTTLFVVALFYMFPVRLGVDGVIIVIAVIMLPLGSLLVFNGEVTSQLESRMTARYWTFSFESPSGSTLGDANNFSLSNKQPSSIITVLTITNFLVQMMEVVGLEALDKAELVQARNHFLYRIRNSNSFRHRAIATELFFRKVSELVLKRTAVQFVKPASASLSIIENQFTQRMIERSEIFIKPLPDPLDPDSPLKLLVMAVVTLISHKRMFRLLKEYRDGKLNSALQATKHLSRFIILIYLSGRYLIHVGKNRNNQNGIPPRMYS